MAQLKIKGNDLKKAGVPAGPLAGLAVSIAKKFFRKGDEGRFLRELALVGKSPEDFEDNPVWAPYAKKLSEHRRQTEERKEIELEEEALPYKSWGKEGIEEGAIKQMDIALRLPVSRKGALMADAHQGYGLPIGGVLGVENAVIPYGVGMDL